MYFTVLDCKNGAIMFNYPGLNPHPQNHAYYAGIICLMLKFLHNITHCVGKLHTGIKFDASIGLGKLWFIGL